MQVAWSVIGTPSHKGSKTCRRAMTQQVQHKVAAAGVWALAQHFMAHRRVLSHDDINIPAMR